LKSIEISRENSAGGLFLDGNLMRHFCTKSGYFSRNRKRREINLLSESRSIFLGNSYRMWLHEKQADPESSADLTNGNNKREIDVKWS
jgi:hypothetical protein